VEVVVLIRSPKHSPADLGEWARLEKYDVVLAGSPGLARKERKALADVRAFAAAGPCYLGVSWGKDSVVTADIACRGDLNVPLVWVRVEPIANPDCVVVRDAFLATHPGARYEEVEIWCTKDGRGWHATGTLERGFTEAASRHGDRHVSGVRAEEAGYRKMRMRVHGTVSRRTCAPIGWWSGADVFAYLAKYNLPVHPAYAMSFGGVVERSRLRVSSLGGERGTGFGRRDWESRYYPEVYRELRE
jgi:phosphoadenosine phosphosulfate reductase